MYYTEFPVRLILYSSLGNTVSRCVGPMSDVLPLSLIHARNISTGIQLATPTLFRIASIQNLGVVPCSRNRNIRYDQDLETYNWSFGINH
jgi:hypothetical protein